MISMETLLFVGGDAHGTMREVEADAPAWKVFDRSHSIVLYVRRRWAAALSAGERTKQVDLMVYGDPDPIGVASAMAIAWMREHGRA